MGFLHARGIEEGGGKISRWERYVAAGVDPPLPPVEAGWYLVEAFQEIGFASQTADGPIPLGWYDLAGFARWDDGLTREEAIMLRRMSAAFLEGMQVGASPLGIPPWQGD
jgi:hypothetical protein